MKKIFLLLFLILNAQNNYTAEQADQKHEHERALVQDIFSYIKEYLSQLEEKYLALENSLELIYQNRQIFNENEIKTCIEIFKDFIIKLKIDLNKPFSDGSTTLTVFIILTRLHPQYEELTDFVKWLIANGADINDHYIPLTYCIKTLHINLFTHLINLGADVNNDNGYKNRTPLYNALEKISQEIPEELHNLKFIMKQLLINGARFHYVDERYQHYLDIQWYFAQPNMSNTKKIYEEICKEIIEEYRAKIDAYNKKYEIIYELYSHHVLKDLGHIVAEYAAELDYSDDNILDNIMHIRKTLGELTPDQEKQYLKREEEMFNKALEDIERIKNLAGQGSFLLELEPKLEPLEN